MSERKTFDIKRSLLLLGVFLTVLFASTVVVLAYGYDSVSGNRTYNSGSMHIYIKKQIGTTTSSSTYSSATLTFSRSAAPSWEDVASTSGKSTAWTVTSSNGAIRMAAGSYATVKSWGLPSGYFSGISSWATSGAGSYYTYIVPVFKFDIPTGYRIIKDSWGGLGCVTNDAPNSMLYFTAFQNNSAGAGKASPTETSVALPTNITAIGLRTSYSDDPGKRYKNTSRTIYLRPNQTTITYAANGATGGSTGNTTLTYDYSNAFASNGFIRPGYTFTGWKYGDTVYGGANGNSANNSIKTLFPSATSATVTAQWQANSKTVTFNANGGTGSSIQTFTSGKGQSFAETGISRTGYDLIGWSEVGGNNSVMYGVYSGVSNDWIGTGGSKTLYAVWDGYEGEIEFDANGGDGVMDNQEYKFGTTANLNKCELENEGYKFIGWNTEEDGSGDYYTDEADIKTAFPTGNAYLYAIWQPTGYTLHFNGNNETGGEMQNVQGEIDKALTLPDNEFYKTEKVFKEWNTMPDGNGYSYKDKSEYVVNSNLLNNTEQMNFTVNDGAWNNGKFRNASTSFPDNREVVEISDSPVKELNKAYKITSTAGTHTDVAQDGVPVVAGEVYTMSVWAKGQGNLLLQYGAGPNYANTQYPVNSDEWNLYTYTFTAGTDGTVTNERTNIYFGNQSTENGQELYLTGLKLEKGNKATPYFISEENEVTLYAQWLGGTFKIEGETSVSGYKFEEVYTENGKIDFATKLGNGQFFSIFDLDKEAQYKVAEIGNKNSRNYSPSFEVTDGGYAVDTKKGEAGKGETLSTPNEILAANMDYQYTNAITPPEGKSISFTKKLAGDGLTDADKNSSFQFFYSISGLDPEQSYPCEKITADGTSVNQPSVTPEATVAPGSDGYETSGYINSTVYLKSGETFSVDGLPEGAKYSIIEIFTDASNWQYKTTYEVTSGEETTQTDFDTSEGKNLPIGLYTNNYYYETLGGEDVSYTFKNSKITPHNLTLSKRVTENNVTYSTNEEFEVVVSLSNLSPNKFYESSNQQYNFVADDKGKAEFTVTLTHGTDVILYNLPSDVEYELTEKESPYEASVKVNTPATVYETSGMYGQGVSVSNNQTMIDSEEEIGFNSDQTVLFTNNQNTNHSLSVEKNVSGSGASSKVMNVTKYSHTPNISDDGIQNGDYANNLNLNDVITIPGAKNIQVEITASGESTSYDWACVWDGDHPDYTAYDDYPKSYSGKLGGSDRRTIVYDIPGDTVTIGYRSDGSVVGDGYGYYAKITGVSGDIFEYNLDIFYDSGPFNITKTSYNENGEEVTTTDSFDAGNDPSYLETGRCTYSFTLYANERIKIDGLSSYSYYKLTELGSEGYTPSYTAEGPVSIATDVGESGEPLSTPREAMMSDVSYSFTNHKDNPPPVKKVSDTDNYKFDGEGPEILVEENSVPDRDKTWTYTVTQRIYKGFDDFTFDDFIPENTLLNGNVSIKWTKENGRVVQNALVQVVEEGEPVENQYTSGTFYVDLDNGVHVTSEDSSLISAGGTFEITIPVKVDPEATIEDFKAAGQIYKVNERLQFKNRASTTVGTSDFTNNYSSNLVKTNIPLNTALNIKKNVTGNLGDLTKQFEYELKLSGLTPNKKYTYEKPTYVKVHGDYDDEGCLTITATDEKDRPIKKVEIQIFKEVEKEESEPTNPVDVEDNGDEVITEPDESEYNLVTKRITGEDGQTRFTLEPGEYKYVITYDDEKTEGFFTAALKEEGDRDNSTLIGSVEELDEIYFERTDYDTEKYFLTDENGNAVIEFKLTDDQEMLFTKLPINVVYEITEKASNHTPSFEVTEGVVKTRSKAMKDKEVDITTGEETLKGTTSYLFTNHRELEPRTAGYVMLVSMLILTLAGLIVALFFRRKKKTLSE